VNSNSYRGDVEDDIVYPSALPFVLVHAACLAVIWSGVTWQAVAMGLVLYWLRIFAIGAGYHRYFSHRSYSTSRVFQHRHHHLHSDTPHDVHSPRHKGFLCSHLGWIFAHRHAEVDLLKVSDLARYPELMWLHKYGGR
jgi:stearoyl-CoA desaturase (delta-9 desaturase)